MTEHQIVLRGKDEDQPVIEVKMVPGEGGKTGFPIKFPCLSVKVARPGDTDNHYAVTWSNYYEAKGPQPGKFKLRRVEMLREMVYVKDGNRKMTITRQNCRQNVIDYVAMAKQWSTHWTGERFEYGEDHPMARTDVWTIESETVQGFYNEILPRFGDALAREILTVIVTHERYQDFVEVEEKITDNGRYEYGCNT